MKPNNGVPYSNISQKTKKLYLSRYTKHSRATIQAFDDPDGTIYVLCRPGHEPMMCPWPQPLLKLEPRARWLASIR